MQIPPHGLIIREFGVTRSGTGFERLAVCLKAEVNDMNRLWIVTVHISAAMLISTSVVLAEVECQERNWNHGTNQSMSVRLPAGSTTKAIIMSVKNLDDNEYQGKCPSGVQSNTLPYEKRQCEPAKLHDMTVESVVDNDEGDRHMVTVAIKNGDQAPPRMVKLCTKYDK